MLLAIWDPQCYLLPDTSEHTPPSSQTDRLVLDLPTPEPWKAELTQVTWFTQPQTVTHPSTNQAQCQLTTLIELNALTTTLRCHPIDRDPIVSDRQDARERLGGTVSGDEDFWPVAGGRSEGGGIIGGEMGKLANRDLP